MGPEAHEYDVALSFAGADREIARIIASIAEANGLRVFLDEQHLWQSWGKNLNEYLGDIYDGASRYCVILVSKEYCERAYTNVERRRALDRALESKVEYILPVRLDDSWIEGLPRATAYMDLRDHSSIDVGASLVRKVKGAAVDVVVPEGVAGPKVVPGDPGHAAVAAQRGSRPGQPIDFVDVRVAAECRAWKSAESRERDGDLAFRGGFGWYEDPIFDITIMNRLPEPVLLTAVGIQAVRLSCEGVLALGGGGSGPVDLHRTYVMQLPDLWQALARAQRARGAERPSIVDVDELAPCRLPDPILMEGHRPYRFALHLFDYTFHCPAEVELFFWARTDRGEARSERSRLAYVIGGDIGPLMRYRRLLGGDDEVRRQGEQDVGYLRPDEKERRLRALAYELWTRAGSPPGRDAEFWRLAESELPSRLLAEDDVRGVHKRPMDLAAAAPAK